MKLSGLPPLYGSMKSQNIDRYRFDYKVGKALFDVFFFIDSLPFILLFGLKIDNFSFELEVRDGFQIDHNLDKTTYKKLCKVLGLEYDPSRPFSPWSFFKEFNRSIPNTAFLRQVVKSNEISKYVSISEEADKIYFYSWLDNSQLPLS